MAELHLTEASNLIKGIQLPPRPQLMADISEAYPDITKVAAVIATDQGVSAGVLRAVNSPLYGLPHRVKSLRRAVVILGLSSVLNIVNAMFLRAALGNTSHPLFPSYWQSSTDTGIACATLSRHLRLNLDEPAYLTGLFHNCGIPLLLRKFPEYSDVLVESYTSAHPTSLEESRLGTQHASVGAWIAHYWKLPDSVCEAIQMHHQSSQALQEGNLARESLLLLAMLKVAEHAAGVYHNLGQSDVDHEWIELQPVLCEYLGHSVHALMDLVNLAASEVEEQRLRGLWPQF